MNRVRGGRPKIMGSIPVKVEDCFFTNMLLPVMASTQRHTQWVRSIPRLVNLFNRLTPNDPYMGRTAPLTSKRCILYIYLTNIGAEYFKHALYSPFFLFKMLFVL